MNVPDWFQTITEVAIGLAGFSGLAVALRRDTGPLSDVQKFRMGVLFGTAFGALFLSLFPYLLQSQGLSDNVLWRISSLGMALWSLSFLYLWVTQSRRVAKAAPEIFSRTAFTVMSAGHVANLCLQLAVAGSLIEENGAGFFGAGLVWFLAHSAQQFVRMLFIQPKDDHV